ncbi:MAG TPA: fibrobacter succinogenes major paralogous domain-containing protein, partial [Bacteroidales bacterium]|nr:fibrobacter succinogenes major paralogous domain-containing protein [Bacteroidales bacterium]
ESVINIDHQSAESGGNINDDGGSPVTNRGICWDTSPGPTKETNTGFTNDGEGTGMFSSSMTGLEANTLYYLRAYATNDVGTSYGDQLEFTTERNPDLPAVTTSTVLDIDSYTAVSGGEISDQGSSEVLLRGVCWSVSTNPTIDDEYTEDGAGTGTYTSNITGLYSGTTYYVRAFASNSYGIAYGNELSFTTLPGPSTVEIGELRSKAGLVSVDADIIRDGGAEITGRGFVWSTAPNPDLSLNDGYSTEGQGSGTYTGEISGLSINTDYYVRAWATNSEGTSYSGQLLFHFWDYGTITDIDGNSYNTVTIGSQVWMAENLRVARYTTAIPIPGGLTNEEWETTTSGAYAVYPHSSAEGLNSEEEVLEAYGALYNWYAVETGNLCPTGWRVPTEDDWTQLTDHLLNNYDSINSSNISNYLKSRRQVDSPLGGEFATSNHPRWDYDNDDYGKDFIGFSALPGGYRSSGGTFWYIGSGWYFWLFTEASVEDARYSYIYNRDGTIRKFSTNKLQGNTVRCTKE